MNNFDVIVAAAGESRRFNADKLTKKLPSGLTVLESAVLPFTRFENVATIYLVVAPERTEEFQKLFDGFDGRLKIVAGGKNRTESVKAALALCSSKYVLVHDGARPYVSPKVITDVMCAVEETGTGVPAVPLSDSLARCDGKPVDRSIVRAVQTPQGFLTEKLKSAYSHGRIATDDAALYHLEYGNVTLTEGDPKNVKITYPSDVPTFRAGTGYDVHRLEEGRKLVLCGVEIPFEKGLLGHSDADAPLHALMDAVLSAAGLPDIGHFFPADDEKYEGADSAKLLLEVLRTVYEKGLRLVNASIAIIAEKPKLAPYVDEMKDKVAEIAHIDPLQIGISVTTNEKVGDIGDGEAIAAVATVLLSDAN